MTDPANNDAAEEGTTAASTAGKPQIVSATGPLQTEAPPRIGLVASLDDIPAVAAYLRRAGARAINFRTAKVEEVVNGYPKPLGKIAFARDGGVTLKGDVAPPTPDEEAAIKLAFTLVEFPKPATLTAIGTPPSGVDVHDPKVFVFTDFNGQIVLLQKRYDKQDGSKGFLSYTYWSDGRWREMEPDTLPFFGLPGWQDHSTLFLHEGAGAAARVKRILANEEQADFPWREEMRWGHHVGWIGGVFAVEKSDWAALASKNWKRVIIVADNDDNGMIAAHQIARRLTGDVSTVTFDQRFKDGFDCGDDWPADQFEDGGAYIGPSMDDCLRSAMQATEEGEPEPGQRGRPPSLITRAFA